MTGTTGAWFVTAISADKKRQLHVPLDFLKPGGYSVKLYKDSPDSKKITVEELSINTAEGLRINIESNGGLAVKFPNSRLR